MGIDRVFQILISLLFLGYIFSMYTIAKKHSKDLKPEDYNNIPGNVKKRKAIRLNLMGYNLIAIVILLLSFLFLGIIKAII